MNVYGDGFLDLSAINITSKSDLPKASKTKLAGSDIRYTKKRKKYHAEATAKEGGATARTADSIEKQRNDK